MTKRVFVLRIVAVLIVLICLIGAYYAGYAKGQRQLDGAIAWSGDWLWFSETENGTAYVLDANGDCDGTVRIDFGDGNWTELPLYVW